MEIVAVDPNMIDPTSMSSTYKVFGNLHMQWMGIWMCPYNITGLLVDQAFWKSPRILGNSWTTNDGEVQ
jgi:hypothetical protein